MIDDMMLEFCFHRGPGLYITVKNEATVSKNGVQRVNMSQVPDSPYSSVLWLFKPQYYYMSLKAFFPIPLVIQRENTPLLHKGLKQV